MQRRGRIEYLFNEKAADDTPPIEYIDVKAEATENNEDNVVQVNAETGEVIE